MNSKIIITILLLTALLSTSALAATKSVETEKYGIVTIDIHRVTPLEKFFRNINPFTVVVTPNTVQPGGSINVQSYDNLNYDASGLRSATLTIGDSLTAPYLQTIDVSAEVVSECPLQNNLCLGSAAFDVNIALTAPNQVGTYIVRVKAISYANQYMADDSTSFYVENEQPTVCQGNGWHPWVNIGPTVDGHGDQFYREYFTFTAPACSVHTVTQTEQKTECDSGWYIEGTADSRVGSGLKACYQPGASQICTPNSFNEISKTCDSNTILSVDFCYAGTTWVPQQTNCAQYGKVCQNGECVNQQVTCPTSCGALGCISGTTTCNTQQQTGCPQGQSCWEAYMGSSSTNPNCSGIAPLFAAVSVNNPACYDYKCSQTDPGFGWSSVESSKCGNGGSEKNSCNLASKPCDSAVCKSDFTWDNSNCLQENKTLTYTQSSFLKSEWYKLTPEQRISSVCSIDANCAPYIDDYGNENYTVKCRTDPAFQNQLTEDYKTICKTSGISKLLSSIGIVGGIGCVSGLVVSGAALAGIFTPAAFIGAATLSATIGTTIAVCSGEALIIGSKQIGCSIWAQEGVNKGVCIATANGNANQFGWLMETTNILGVDIPVWGLFVAGFLILLLLMRGIGGK